MATQWEEMYQQQKTGWDRGESSANLQHWIDNKLLTPCRILVPGCGNGYEVLTLASKGFDVVAIDIAPSPISNLKQALQENNLNAELIQADFFSWKAEQPFDAIYEQTSLCALPPSEWQTYERCLHDWLKPSGKLFAQFMQTGQEGGPPYHCEITDMESLFSKQRWEWSEQHHTGVTHSKDKAEHLFLLEKIA